MVTDQPIMRHVRELAPVAIATVLAALFIRVLLFQPYEIPSESMLPTLEVGNRVVVNRATYQLGEIQRGQVVVFERPPNLEGKDDMIKRIIGLPGETVRFIDNEIYIGELRVVEPYLVSAASTPQPGKIPDCAQEQPLPNRCIVPDGHVFVLGDNRASSVDSRDFGPIPIDTLIGRAFWKVWPATDLSQL